MNREQIIEMTKEANRYASHKTGDSNEWHEVRDQHFAVLIAAAEREACAQLENDPLIYTKHSLAAAIRARGETK